MLEKLKQRLEHLKEISKLPEEERNVRYDICKSCEHFISLTTQCTQCGCVMAAKTYLPFSSCPIGKWEKVVIEHSKKD
jgi:hypothetical protein